MLVKIATISILIQASCGFEWRNVSMNEQLSQLAVEVIEGYFGNNKCIIVIKDLSILSDICVATNNSFMHIATQDLCDDDLARQNIVQAFRDNCNGFVVQISNPECFMKVWTESLFETIQRPNPKVFYLPVVNETFTNISQSVFSMRETEITEKILVAEYTEDSEWPISLYTNNFYVPVGTPGREDGIFLDRWSFENGFENGSELYPDKTANMRGKKLRLMTFDYVPYSQKEPFDGFEVMLIQQFCLIYNCSVELVDDGMFWGSIYKNGTGDGLNGMVYTDRADFGVAANYLWTEEFFYIDYSHTYLRGAVTLLVPKAVPLSGWRVPFLPFDLLMWSTFGLSLIVATVFMSLITAATIKYTRFKDEVIKRNQFITIQDSFLTIIGMSVLQQPSIPLVPHTPIRHLFTSFEVLYLVLTTCYSAELSSYLTVPQYTKPIDTFHQLAVQNFQWAAVHEAFSYALKFAEDSDAKTVFKNFHKFDIEKLKKVAKTGKYGLTIERCPSGHYSEHEHITEDVIDNSHIMSENLFGSPVVTVIRKASPYEEKLDKLITLLLDGGMFIIWEQKAAEMFLSPRKQLAVELSRSSTGKDAPTTLSLGHIQGTFMIYGSGIVLSTTVFLYELFKSSKRKRSDYK